MLLSKSDLLANLMLKQTITDHIFSNLNRERKSVIMKSILWSHSLSVGVLEPFERVEILGSMNVLFMESHLLNASQET